MNEKNARKYFIIGVLIMLVASTQVTATSTTPACKNSNSSEKTIPSEPTLQQIDVSQVGVTITFYGYLFS